LFTPHGFLTSTAFCVKVHCDDLQITDIPEGICPLRIKVLRRYGQAVELGQITKWEDHNQPPTALVFPKGSTAYHATYAKPGSPETRRLTVYASRDGANSFFLEAIPGGSFTGDNVAISKQFMLLQIEYEAAGFSHRQSASGGSSYPLFVKSGG